MTDAFATHDAYETDDGEYALTTTPFDGRVVVDGDEYRVSVTMPTLDAAVEEPVDEVVEDGWFETLSLRLADAEGATRADIEVPDPTVERRGGKVVVEWTATLGDATRAAEAAKALIEYAEGTYVEGIVPGYAYRSPVADLIANARTEGDGEDERGPMPL
ncbi:DUF5813 family protein [Halococcus sp. AFM35]|uniref:DUF5813 family protein n=1 Tax=Halococcus sp. AFM35 TaxID=3421653 RepID=UPI003EB8DC86